MRAEAPVWIWYPGDLEVWLHMQVSIRRTEREVIIPPLWRMDNHYQSVKFRKIINLDKPETVTLYAEGRHNVSIDDKMIYNVHEFILPAGEHKVLITVYNDTCVPSIYMKGESVITDTTWEVSCDYNNWVKVDSWNFTEVSGPPSGYSLATKEIKPVSTEYISGSVLLDFGKETFGYLKLSCVSGRGRVHVYYGESREEALSSDFCETMDTIYTDGKGIYDYTLSYTKAFRYINISFESTLKIENFSALYEYLPLEYRGSFRCSDQLINRIWDTSVYTFHLNTREFFLDGIKRDRWVWSGDAYQSFLMNYYIFFDEAVTRRTLVALRGKDPVGTHMNTIVDYTFFWFMGMYDYYLYTGDRCFIERYYPRMVTLMEFCLGRKNSRGMLEGKPEDWVFIDWADMDKDGEISFEQLLFCRSLEIMSEFSSLLGTDDKAAMYGDMAERIKKLIFEEFWDSERGLFIHGKLEGKSYDKVTRYANMFAMMLGYLDEGQVRSIKRNVLLNNEVQKIITPYMRFYELAALCEIGEHEYVAEEMRSYWGGMLDRGATTFWEKYDPSEVGVEQYAMYDRPFGKSLCHAWGASPVYLLGKYFLGVKPVEPGYGTYTVEPKLGGLSWINGAVPTPYGDIEVFMNSSTIKIIGVENCTGYLRFHSALTPKVSSGDVVKIRETYYELKIEPGMSYELIY